VKRPRRARAALLNGRLQAVAQAGRGGATSAGSLDAAELEPTQHDANCGQVPRKRQVTDEGGRVHGIAVTVYGWQALVWVEARTKIPLPVQVVKSHDPEVLCRRALVMPAQATPAGATRLDQLAVDRGFWAGPELGWLDQRGITGGVPAKANMAVTADARAQGAAGEEATMGRRVHAIRHGQGRTTWAERLETEVIGIAGLTTYDQYGTVGHGHHHIRHDFQPNPINAVVVRRWNGRDYGPGGKTVFLTNAAVTKLLQSFDDDDRSLIENCCITEAKQQWDLGHSTQKTERAVWVHVVFTLLIFVLATAYRWQYEQAATGEEAVDWQRWRRQPLPQTREKVIVFAQYCDGILPVVEYSLLLGVKLKKLPPGIGTYQAILAKYGLAGDS
jgi:hypothetical protein